jgi:hypothetical protein
MSGSFICKKCEDEGKGPGERFKVPDTVEGEAEMILHLIKDHNDETLAQQIDAILHGGIDYDG